jgi:5-methylcytosine-specific restriction endonuclease McrA
MKNRLSSSRRGYSSTWRRFAASFLREHPTCKRCGAPASDVHHVHPLNDFPLCAYTEDYLEALCHRCHTLVTRGVLPASGEEAKQAATAAVLEVFRA